jgi:hypothetical protein
MGGRRVPFKRGGQWMMLLSSRTRAPAAPPPEVADFLFRILANCLDISSVWSIGHDPEAQCAAARTLLAFADQATLRRLRAGEYLHEAQIEFLVVIDGDLFESAWGPCKLSGSLARWAWRQTTSQDAYYDEARWAEGGGVVRVRRHARLIWERATAETA